MSHAKNACFRSKVVVSHPEQMLAHAGRPTRYSEQADSFDTIQVTYGCASSRPSTLLAAPG